MRYPSFLLHVSLCRPRTQSCVNGILIVFYCVHGAMSQKIMGSIPVGVIVTFR